MSKSDGSTADYYQLPEGCTELQDLISFRNLNAQDGEMFRAIYRKGRASHSDELRDARKVLFYATAEVKRLEALSEQYRPDGFDAGHDFDSQPGPVIVCECCGAMKDKLSSGSFVHLHWCPMQKHVGEFYGHLWR